MDLRIVRSIINSLLPQNDEDLFNFTNDATEYIVKIPLRALLVPLKIGSCHDIFKLYFVVISRRLKKLTSLSIFEKYCIFIFCRK